ncbi:MAG: alpha/beta hydrolase [Chloroflexota bacterium]
MLAPARPASAGRRIERGPRPEDRLLRLRDGRRLGYAESGAADGAPVLFFHGLGTTRVICPPEQPARELGLRLIAIDRPGIGLSEPQPGRSLLDWPLDVAELADQLGLERFSIVAWSGGGPYGLVCGVSLPERIKQIAAVSPAAPLAGPDDPGYLSRRDRGAVRVAGRAPWLIRLAMWHWGRGQRRDAEAFFEKSFNDMCAADQEVLGEPELRGRMIANSAELYRQGGRGMYDEALVLARPWGFEPADLKVPVHIWQGGRDDTVPPAMATHLVEAIPSAQLHFFPDEGHHLLYRYWAEILAALK